MIVEIGNHKYKWKKRARYWIAPCAITEGCGGTMKIMRSTKIAKCDVCKKHKNVELNREPAPKKKVGI